MTKTLLRAISVAALLAEFWLSAGCGTPAARPLEPTVVPGQDQGQYLPNDRLEISGSPPIATVSGDDRRLAVISLDWAALNGEVRTPTPPIRWSERRSTGNPLVVSIATPQQPIRVVAYHYETVDSSGVPRESPEAEELCVRGDGWCSYGSGQTTRVQLPPLRPGTYVVIQAAWITAVGSDVQLSYAWRTTR